MCREDAIAVADGVGGWSNNPEANPALYSSLMTRYIYQELARLEELPVDDPENVKFSPIKVIQNAYDKIYGVIGSCTILLAALRGEFLKIANLGDGGLLIVRNGKVSYRTKEQQHSFNFPFQLGPNSQNTPKDACLEEFQVHEGDILVMASDGLFDNLFDSQIIEILEGYRLGQIPGRKFPVPLLQQYPKPRAAGLGAVAGNQKTSRFDVNAVSQWLAKEALDVSCDPRARSPFESKASQEGILFQGGKPDDISVIVSIVEKRTNYVAEQE